MTISSDNGAHLAGYTEQYMADGGIYEMHISVKPGTDLDAPFKAFDHDEQRIIVLNGWMFDFDPITS